TPAEAPLIDAEILFRQPQPPQPAGSNFRRYRTFTVSRTGTFATSSSVLLHLHNSCGVTVICPNWRAQGMASTRPFTSKPLFPPRFLIESSVSLRSRYTSVRE